MNSVPSGASRPRTVDEMVARMKQFRSPEALERGLSIEVRPDDVFVSTYPKSGTTWLQQVVHGLRSAGSMEFEEIGAVVPWLESCLDIGIDPDADQGWSPRAFKAHLEWERIPKGGRYITALRDPKSVLPSFYRFFEGWFFEPGSISLEAFAREWFMGGTASGRYWDHVRSWWPLVDRSDVLVLTYEDMVASPRAVAPAVAKFLEMDASGAVVEIATRQSTRDFMAAHSSQFDEHLLRQARDRVWGLPPDSESTKVQARATDVTVDSQLSSELDAIWDSEIGAVLGFRSYDELRASLPDPLGARS